MKSFSDVMFNGDGDMFVSFENLIIFPFRFILSHSCFHGGYSYFAVYQLLWNSVITEPSMHQIICALLIQIYSDSNYYSSNRYLM